MANEDAEVLAKLAEQLSETLALMARSIREYGPDESDRAQILAARAALAPPGTTSALGAVLVSLSRAFRFATMPLPVLEMVEVMPGLKLPRRKPQPTMTVDGVRRICRETAQRLAEEHPEFRAPISAEDLFVVAGWLSGATRAQRGTRLEKWSEIGKVLAKRLSPKGAEIPGESLRSTWKRAHPDGEDEVWIAPVRAALKTGARLPRLSSVRATTLAFVSQNAPQFLTSRDRINGLAARSSTDPRTVAKYLSGGRVRLSVEERIDAAARDLGIEVPDPDDAA